MEREWLEAIIVTTINKYDREAIWSAICQRAYNDGYWMGHVRRLFYTFKAIICLLLNQVEEDKNTNKESLMISCFGGGKSFDGEMTMEYWDSFYVFLGVFKNWSCYLITDTSC